MKTRPSIQHRASLNTAPCSVPGCASPRHGASNYCTKHMTAAREYGHPRGRRVFPKEYALERKQAAALLKANGHHTGVANALSWLASWMESAGGELARLHAQGVAPSAVLEECAALWTYSHRNPHRLPDDARLTFALGRAVLHLAPRPSQSTYTYRGRTFHRYPRIPKHDRQTVGATLRDTLGLLLHNVATSLDRDEKARKDARISLAEPLNLNTGTL